MQDTLHENIKVKKNSTLEFLAIEIVTIVAAVIGSVRITFLPLSGGWLVRGGLCSAEWRCVCVPTSWTGIAQGRADRLNEGYVRTMMTRGRRLNRRCGKVSVPR